MKTSVDTNSKLLTYLVSQFNKVTNLEEFPRKVLNRKRQVVHAFTLGNDTYVVGLFYSKGQPKRYVTCITTEYEPFYF